MSVNDIVQWVMEHRCGKVFRDFTRDEIALEVLDAMKCNGLAIVSRGQEVVGLVIGQPNHTAKTLRIKQLLCTSRGAVPGLLARYQQHFAGYQMVARRHGIERQYDTERFLKKLARL